MRNGLASPLGTAKSRAFEGATACPPGEPASGTAKADTIGHRQRLVGAVEKLDGVEDHLLVAQVREFVDLVLAGAVGLVARLAGKIVVLHGAAVHQMLAAAAAVHRGPEIIQHMAMESDPLAWRQPDDPDTDLVGLRQQLTADATVVLAAFALELGLEFGRPFAAILGARFLVQHGQSHGIPPTLVGTI